MWRGESTYGLRRRVERGLPRPAPDLHPKSVPENQTAQNSKTPDSRNHSQAITTYEAVSCTPLPDTMWVRYTQETSIGETTNQWNSTLIESRCNKVGLVLIFYVENSFNSTFRIQRIHQHRRDCETPRVDPCLFATSAFSSHSR